MFELTPFTMLLAWIAIFFGGMTIWSFVKKHRAQWELLQLFCIILLLIALALIIGQRLGLV